MKFSKDLIKRRKDILEDTPVFKGNQVPIKTSVEYLEAVHSLNGFLEDYPAVSRKTSLT